MSSKDCFNCPFWHISNLSRFTLVFLLPLIIVILSFLLMLLYLKHRHPNRIGLQQNDSNINSSEPPPPPYNWHPETPPPPPYLSK